MKYAPLAGVILALALLALFPPKGHTNGHYFDTSTLIDGRASAEPGYYDDTSDGSTAYYPAPASHAKAGRAPGAGKEADSGKGGN